MLPTKFNRNYISICFDSFLRSSLYRSLAPIHLKTAIAAVVFSTLIISTSYISTFEAFAEDSEHGGLNAQTSDSLNAVLLMDSSASMLVNDPDKLRDQGARLLLQFLKSGDKLAIIGFDEAARIVRPLSPFNSDQLATIQSSLNSIEASGQYTDLDAGLQAAQAILSKVNPNDGNPVIILLSDGKMDPAPSRGTVESHLDDLSNKILPALKNSKIRVYTLAFSQDADRPLLQHIAQSTDGINWFTPNSDTIHESFADLFLSLKKPQVVPYGSKGFKIDADVEEATFYINQPENASIEIEDPNEERFSAQNPGDYIRWFDGKKFSVITIAQPQAGEWKLIGVNPDEGFATILTNLKLVTDWPNGVPVNESILLQARLYEGKIPVDLETMAQAVTFAFQITPSDRVSEPIMRDFLNDEGKNGDEKANDGIFSQQIKLADAGEYKLRLVSKGPTFERQLQIPFRVRPPLISFSVENATDSAVEAVDHEIDSKEHAEDEHSNNAEGQHSEHAEPKKAVDKKAVIEGSQRAIFSVRLNDEASTLKNISVSIVAVDKDRQKYELSAKAAKANSAGGALLYEASAAALPKDGQFELKASLEAKTRDGKALEEDSEVVKFARKSIKELSDHAVVHEVESEHPVEVKPAANGFDWIALVVITLLNFALGGAFFFLMKKKKAQVGSGESLELPKLSLEVTSGVEDLVKRSQSETVNLEDERFVISEAEAAASASEEATNNVAG